MAASSSTGIEPNSVLPPFATGMKAGEGLGIAVGSSGAGSCVGNGVPEVGPEVAVGVSEG